MNLTHGSLYTGIGGFDLGARMQKIETLWMVEKNPYAREVLQRRFPDTPLYGDIRWIHSLPYVDIISGGFPCQEISQANSYAKGMQSKKSGWGWNHMYRICRVCKPRYIIVENSARIIRRGFEQILTDLTHIGYDTEWQCLSGTTFGMQQGRGRLYLIAYPHQISSKGVRSQQVFRQPYLPGVLPRIYPGWRTRSDIPQPRTYGSVDGIPHLVDRIGVIGQSVMPKVTAYLFWCIKHREGERLNAPCGTKPGFAFDA